MRIRYWNVVPLVSAIVLCSAVVGYTQHEDPEIVQYEDSEVLALAKEYGGVGDNLQRVVEVRISSEEAADALIPHLHRLQHLVFVHVLGVDLSDAHLESLAR